MASNSVEILYNFYGNYIGKFIKLNLKSTALWLTVDAVIIVAWKLINPDAVIDGASVIAIVVSTVVISNTNGWQKK